MLISTWNYTDANLQAWSILQQGRHRTRQAVIQGCLGCLGIRCGRQLGGGSGPNELGQLSLEAAIMDGENLNYGAVAGIEGVRNAILVADSVLRHTKHTLLVGKSATLFARSMGYKEQNSPNGDTEQSMWGWRFNGCQPNYWRDVRPLETSRCGPYHPLPENLLRHPMRQEYPIIQDEHDQIAMLALDAEGRIHVASQASGSRFRIAGRVGDSAVPGAGIYADNKVGGALATGDGDVLMRLLPAFLAVEALRDGQKPAQAAKKVIQRVLKYHTEFNGAVIVVTRWGTYAAACAGMDEFNFVVSGGKSHLSMARVERVKCQNRENEIVD
ncbi:hypothetical protein KR018_009585, partial [Drosophila ironensis]